MTIDTIDDLIHRLEAAAGPDRRIDVDIWEWLDVPMPDDGWPPRYTASIDVALTLVPNGWYAIITARGDGPHCVLQEFPQPCRRVPDREPYVIRPYCSDIIAGSAIAICICALSAMALGDNKNRPAPQGIGDKR